MLDQKKASTLDDIDVGPSKTQNGFVYIMAHHKTLSVKETKQLIRKLRDAVSEAERLRPCSHPPHMTFCVWCADYGETP